MDINILRNKISWFGKYSGYECLTDYFKEENLSMTIPKDKFLKKSIGKIVQKYKGWEHAQPAEIYGELEFIRKIGSNQISHILYLESHLHALSIVKKNRNKLVGTIHLPLSEWDQKALFWLPNLENAIILYDEETAAFGKYIDANKIQVIKHGVDVNFFKPGLDELVVKNKILFVGHYLRDFEMFYEVFQIIRKEIGEEIQFHFIMPSFARNTPVIQKLVHSKNVFFHEGLSDEELLDYYQTSYLLLMPLINSGANTAIVQAIATGLPIITTDAGGIRSYGGGKVFPLVKSKASLEMAALFSTYYHDENFRNDISKKQRQFAIDELEWNLIAKQHINHYAKIIEMAG